MDYNQIIKNLTDSSVINLMKKLGVEEYEDTPKAIIFPTICHNHDINDASMKLYYYKDTHLFYCYTEEGAMNIFSFLKNYYETRDYEYNWYEDIYSVVCDCSSLKFDGFYNLVNRVKHKDRYLKQDLKNLEVFSDVVLDVFIKKYPIEWTSDGITKEAMDKFNIKYSISQNKIIIPHYDINNNLVGIRGRALNAWEVENFGKYMPVKVENTWYTHPLSLNLYGLNTTKEDIKKHKICYLFEGEKSVLQMESFNMPNCSCAVCGSNLNKHALKILLKECGPSEIILAFDNEEKEGSEKYFNKLYKMCKKYSNYANFSFIYDREGLTNKKESPTDKGEEVFKELIRRRVKVK